MISLPSTAARPRLQTAKEEEQLGQIPGSVVLGRGLDVACQLLRAWSLVLSCPRGERAFEAGGGTEGDQWGAESV